MCSLVSNTLRSILPGYLMCDLDELKRLHIGQSLDLYWTANVQCPSLEEYLKMVDYSMFPSFVLVVY